MKWVQTLSIYSNQHIPHFFLKRAVEVSTTNPHQEIDVCTRRDSSDYFLSEHISILNSCNNIMKSGNRYKYNLSRFWLFWLGPLVSLLPKSKKKNIWLSNIFALSISIEGCCRNASCAQNLISMFLYRELYAYLIIWVVNGFSINESYS